MGGLIIAAVIVVLVLPSAISRSSWAIFFFSANSSANALRSTFSTVYSSGYQGIWEIRPIRLPAATVISPSSGRS